MSDLLGSLDFVPHAFCLLWNPWLIALHAGSDAVIFASYFVIPVAIIRFLRARPDVPFGGLGVLFASFILFCGLTHLVGVVVLWTPFYELEGLVKLATALVSAATAWILFPLVPKLAALPHPAELEAANADLRAEIERHKATLAELERVRAGLEETVAQRTRALSRTNERLTVVTRETLHRSRNLLNVVRSLVQQTAARAVSKEALVESLAGRIASLSRSLAAVIDDGGVSDLRRIAETQLEPFVEGYAGRIAVEGPTLHLRTEAAQQIALAIHELATNAVKHGALTADGGRVRVAWGRTTDAAALELTWTESGGPPAGTIGVEAGGGFGSRLLLEAVPRQLGGEASLAATDDGMGYRLVVPLVRVEPADDPVEPEAVPAGGGIAWEGGRA